MSTIDSREFATPEDLSRWLAANHDTSDELWIRLYKVKSGIPSVTWEQAVIEALAWGWIDAVKRSLDEVSWLQRFTPRRARSGWSQKNCRHAEKLIAEGRMQPAGLAQVEAAKADGRWDAAYAGQSSFEIPAEFLAELDKSAAAKSMFASLNRQNLFAIYHRLHSAKKPETKQRRMAQFIATLERGETIV